MTDTENTNIEDVNEEAVNDKELPKDDEFIEIPETPSEGMVDSDIYKWYAIRVVAGHENKVKIYLDNQIREEQLENYIKTVMIPLEKVFEVKNGKKKIKYKNFYPGYILLEAFLTDGIKRTLAKVPSVMGVVGAKNIKGQKLEPVPLKDTEIKRIMAILNDENLTEKIDLKLADGDAVKVTNGPFNNFNGVVLEINTEKMKVKVMVSIFGRKTPIELEFNQIEKLK